MAKYADTSVDVPQWFEVSSAQSCPICGGSSQCAVHEDGEFVRCIKVVSDWPVVTGGWLHRIENGSGGLLDQSQRRRQCAGAGATSFHGRRTTVADS